MNDLLESHLGRDSPYLFPLKYCGHRRLENTKAITKVKEISDHLQAYVEDLASKKKLPKNYDRFERIKSFSGNPTGPAVLEFNLSVMKEIEPFLELFQAERPLVVFLYEKVKIIILSLMQRFVRPEVVESTVVRNLIKWDPEKKDLEMHKDESKLLGRDSVDVGFGAKSVFKKLPTVQATQVKTFKSNAKSFLKRAVSKLAERSPLKYKLTQYIAALSLIQISTVGDVTLKKRFDKYLELLCESKWITATIADRAKQQYAEFIMKKSVLEKLNEFDINHDRLHTFYMSLFSSLNLDMNALLDVVKITLILSHGQGRVESGFSINEQVLVENLQEDSIVAQRMVYEGILQEGGASKVDLNRIMLKYVKQARSKQMFALEENRKKQTEVEKRREERKRASKELSEANCCKENCCGTNERESQQL